MGGRRTGVVGVPLCDGHRHVVLNTHVAVDLVENTLGLGALAVLLAKREEVADVFGGEKTLLLRVVQHLKRGAQTASTMPRSEPPTVAILLDFHAATSADFVSQCPGIQKLDAMWMLTLCNDVSQ